MRKLVIAGYIKTLNFTIMSSYLNFYLVTKEDSGSANPLNIYSVSRNDDLYQVFYERNVQFKSSDRNNQNYTVITTDMLDSILTDLSKQITYNEKRVQSIMNNLPEKASERLEMLNEAESISEYNESLLRTFHRVQMIYDIVSGFEYSEFSKLLCNID